MDLDPHWPTAAPEKEPPQNPGGSFRCRPHRPPDTNAARNACSPLPPHARLPKTQALRSCVDRYATPRRESAPTPPSAAHLPTPSVLLDRRGHVARPCMSPKTARDISTAHT